MNGIYGYLDLNSCLIVYIGKDSNIDKNRRHKDHLQLSNYDKQRFNRILQNNPNRYEYFVFEKGNFSESELNEMEQNYISIHNPKFNFTKGGEGTSGYTHSDETKKKIGEANKGWTHSDESKNHLREVKTKKYARILKRGFSSQGKQQYSVRFNGKCLKRSISIDKLVKWFADNYPDEELVIDESIKS